MPHHSARTSSTDEFIAAVQPNWAVLPVGYRNRFGHPTDTVVERYRVSGAQMLRTDNSGAVLLRLDGEGIGVRAQRELKRRYLYSQ